MPNPPEPVSQIERLLGRASLTIRFEKLWPPAIFVAVVLALFITVSWLGFWLLLPAWARLVGVLAFGAALLVPIVSLARVRRASRAEALARLDRDSGLSHGPVSASQDQLADAQADPFTQALWALHRRRALEAVARVKLAPPSPRLVDRDRFALRGAVVVALVAAGFVAGADREGRLASALAWRNPIAAGPGFRVDAWIDPPPYTGRAPILLAGQPDAVTRDQQQQTAAPINSIVVVRSSGAGEFDVVADSGLKATPVPTPAAKPAGSPPQTGPANAERRFVLAGDGHLTLTHDGTVQSTFDLHAIPDLPPTIALTDPPKGNLRGSLILAYKVDDDYGVVGVDAAFSAPVLHGKPVTGRTLVEAPKLPLSLPNGARRLGQGQTTVDLSAHPWAGVEATIVLSARDEGGNVGLSAPRTLRMPTRPFHKPLAKALVEQRQDLVFDPDHREPVLDALEALSLAPELFDTTPAVYLGLGAARTRLLNASSDADLLGVADLLWSMALTIEDGDLSQTERDLRAIQRELKDALARGAPPEEIKRLTEALKQQMEKFLAEMAQRNAEARSEPASPNSHAKSVTQKDLQSLLDKMEQAARNGDMAEAQALLDRLQNILENLRSAQQEGADPNAQQMSQSMSQLDRMMRDQQALRDKTFKRGNHGRTRERSPSDDQDPSTEPDDQAQSQGNDQDQKQAGVNQDNSDLQNQQRDLQQSLQSLQKQMRELGLNGEQGFGDAEQAMKDAESALGKGAPGNDRAVEAQGRALQGLQQGARGLQGQMAQGEGQGDGQSPGDSGTNSADGEGQRDGTDPLGRERNNGDRRLDAQGGPNIGEGLAERARQVLDELRRRLGDRMRPQEEQDYLERLLKRY